jgi:NAD-dependent SIR2 family protein deacetylase
MKVINMHKELRVEKKSACDCCQTIYVKEKYLFCKKGNEHQVKKCPSCGFDPAIENLIEEELSQTGLYPLIASQKIANIVKQKIIEEWPRRG